MHSYPWHVGDYVSHTRHLSQVEDLAYRRILDLYYLHEKPPKGSAATVARSISMSEHEKVVGSVLREFFTESPKPVNGIPEWFNSRVEAELARYREKRDSAKRAAATRWGNKP